MKGFYHTWAWWPSWSCDLDYIYIHIGYPFLLMLHVTFGFVSAVSEEMFEFEYYGDIHVYCHGVGHMSLCGPIFFSESLIFSPTAHFLQDFHFK